MIHEKFKISETTPNELKFSLNFDRFLLNYSNIERMEFVNSRSSDSTQNLWFQVIRVP